jgi:hypothetical protein
MGVTVEGQVGPRVIQDGSNTELRQTRMGGLVVADGHAKYWELASRGYGYTISTAVAGTTLVAGNVSPVGAAAASILTLYNPLNSNVNAAILRVGIGSVSSGAAGVGAGAFAYNVAYNQTVTAVQNAIPISTLTGQQSGSRCKGYTQTALTGSAAQILLRAMAFNLLAGGQQGATTQCIYTAEDIAGSIICPPGGLFTIAAPAVGVTWVISAVIDFEEVPV